MTSYYTNLGKKLDHLTKSHSKFLRNWQKSQQWTDDKLTQCHMMSELAEIWRRNLPKFLIPPKFLRNWQKFKLFWTNFSATFLPTYTVKT